MKEKIVNLMKSEGLSPSRLADILETQPSRISHIVSGRNKPSFDLLQQILRRFPRVNPDWLLLDSDQMYRDSALGSSAEQIPYGSVREEGSSPIDLFDFSASAASAPSSLSGDISTSLNDPFSPSLLAGGMDGAPPQNIAPNSAQNSPQNRAQNQSQFSAENRAQNSAQNGPQNPVQNPSQLPPNYAPSAPAVQRIIVLYSDGTFRSYSAR